MCLTPGIVMVVMESLRDGATDDFPHTLHDPFPARVGITPRQLHGGNVPAPDFTILVDHCWRDVDPIFPASGLQITRGTGMAKASAAEMDADPDVTRLVMQEIDVVIAGSDCAKLRHRFRAVLAHVRFQPGLGVVKQLVLDTPVVGSADAEGNDFRDVRVISATRCRIAEYGVSSRIAIFPQLWTNTPSANAKLFSPGTVKQNTSSESAIASTETTL